jgi:hypothetical protein
MRRWRDLDSEGCSSPLRASAPISRCQLTLDELTALGPFVHNVVGFMECAGAIQNGRGGGIL